MDKEILVIIIYFIINLLLLWLLVKWFTEKYSFPFIRIIIISLINTVYFVYQNETYWSTFLVWAILWIVIFFILNESFVNYLYIWIIHTIWMMAIIFMIWDILKRFLY